MAETPRQAYSLAILGYLAEVRRYVIDRDGPICRYCGRQLLYAIPKGGLTLDHIVPKSKNGSRLPENVVVACGPCNRRKADAAPWEIEDFSLLPRWSIRPGDLVEEVTLEAERAGWDENKRAFTLLMCVPWHRRRPEAPEDYPTGGLVWHGLA